MGHNHHRAISAGLPFTWYDLLLVVAGGALLGLSPNLGGHAELYGVASAVLVGTVVHRLFAWMEQVEQRESLHSPQRATAQEAHPEAPRHSAHAA